MTEPKSLYLDLVNVIKTVKRARGNFDSAGTITSNKKIKESNESNESKEPKETKESKKTSKAVENQEIRIFKQSDFADMCEDLSQIQFELEALLRGVLMSPIDARLNISKPCDTLSTSRQKTIFSKHKDFLLDNQKI